MSRRACWAVGIESFACVPIDGPERAARVPRGELRGGTRLRPARPRGARDARVADARRRSPRAELYEREHEVATRLQISMLATRPPDLSGITLATRYRAAIDELEVGGDWHDVISLPGGRLGLAVGDVVGRGLAAATTMGRLRSALHAIALSEEDPAKVLERLDLFAQRIPEAHLATVVYAIVDAGRRRAAVRVGRAPAAGARRSGREARAARRRAVRPARVVRRSAPGRPRAAARQRAARAASPTGWSSAAASRSTRGSSGCARRSPGSTTTTSSGPPTRCWTPWSATAPGGTTSRCSARRSRAPRHVRSGAASPPGRTSSRRCAASCARGWPTPGWTATWSTTC